MNKTAIAIGISLAAGFAAAALVFNSAQQAPKPAAVADPGDYFDQTAATEDRIRALEEAVAQERNARMLLEEELQVLYTEIEDLTANDRGRRQSEGADGQAGEAVRMSREQMEEIRQQRSGTASERRMAQLIDSGFPPDRAEWLVKRESELWMESLQARYEARVSGEPIDPFDPVLDAQSSLRAEIGDAEYEQYLAGTGRPTSVAISSVFESSPAQSAGLQPGDQIVSYNGTRVFDMGELNRYTMQTDPGGDVVIDIVRDGTPMQVVLPAGPIGVQITSGGRRRR